MTARDPYRRNKTRRGAARAVEARTSRRLRVLPDLTDLTLPLDLTEEIS